MSISAAKNIAPRNCFRSSADEDLGSSLLDRVYASNRSDGGVCQRILYEAFERLGEDDALYGCGSGLLLSRTGRIKGLVHEQRWLEALACCDANIAHASANGHQSHVQQSEPVTFTTLTTVDWTFPSS